MCVNIHPRMFLTCLSQYFTLDSSRRAKMRIAVLLSTSLCLITVGSLAQEKTAAKSSTKGKAKAKPKTACPSASFTPACALPFDAIKQTGLAIDTRCGESGCAAADTPEG